MPATTTGNGEPCGESHIPKDHNCKKGEGSQTQSSPSGRKGSKIPPLNLGSSGRSVGRLPKPVASKKAIALATTAAGLAALAGGVSTIKADISKLGNEREPIRIPPNGKPDAETLKAYDTFEPGSLIRKEINLGGRQAAYHYAVYLGKDSKGVHTLADTRNDDEGRPTFTKARMDLDTGGGSQYEMVPPEEAFSPGSKRFTKDEIQDRVNALAGKRIVWDGFESNCESFARSIVEGVPHTEQGKRVSALTRSVAKIVTPAIVENEGRKEPRNTLGRYISDRSKVNAKTATGLLDKRTQEKRQRELGQFLSRQSRPRNDANGFSKEVETLLDLLDESDPVKFGNKVEMMMAGLDSDGSVKAQLYKLYYMLTLIKAGTKPMGPTITPKRDNLPPLGNMNDVLEELKFIFDENFNGQVMRVLRAGLDEEGEIAGAFRAIPNGQKQPSIYEFTIDNSNKVEYMRFIPVRLDSCQCEKCVKKRKKRAKDGEGRRYDALTLSRGELLGEKGVQSLSRVSRADVGAAGANWRSNADPKWSGIIRPSLRDRMDQGKKGKECGESYIPKDHDCNKKTSSLKKKSNRVSNIVAGAYGAMIAVSAASILATKLRSDEVAGSFDHVYKIQLDRHGMSKDTNPIEAQQMFAKRARQINATGEKMRPGHALSRSEKWSTENVNKALDSLDSPGAKERVGRFREISNFYGIQAVFRSTKEPIQDIKENDERMMRNLRIPAILPGPTNYSVNRPFQAGMFGYTAEGFNHVVVNTNSGMRDSSMRVDPANIKNRLNANLEKAKTGKPNPLTGLSVKNDERAFLTYLHEMGHQIDMKSRGSSRPLGTKDVSAYSTTHEQEWFAESFVHWMVDANAYRKFDPVGAEFIERKMGLAEKEILAHKQRLKRRG